MGCIDLRAATMIAMVCLLALVLIPLAFSLWIEALSDFRDSRAKAEFRKRCGK
jgi:hypothetical protein